MQRDSFSLFFTLYGQGTRLSFHILVSDEVTARCSQAGFMANSPKAQVGMYHVLAPIMRSCAGRGAKAVESRPTYQGRPGPSDVHWGTHKG